MTTARDELGGMTRELRHVLADVALVLGGHAVRHETLGAVALHLRLAVLHWETALLLEGGERLERALHGGKPEDGG